MSQDLLSQIYNAFRPFEPLPAGDPVYVDCQDVRGDTNILQDLGNKILRSNYPVSQLYAGHRGCGKSTEIYRLKAHLEQQGFWVIYFAADDDDIDPDDTQYTDILLACTRNLLKHLKFADPQPLVDWLRDRLQDLKNLEMPEKNFTDLEAEEQFTQLTKSIKSIPSKRKEIRDLINLHTITLLDAVNKFIENAKRKLPQGKSQILLIADNLDRIPPIAQENGRIIHDDIFVDRSRLLQSLKCHIIYTIPISMVYSDRATDLRDIYDDSLYILPMIMVKTRAENINDEGLKKIMEIIKKRFQLFYPDAVLETQVFISAEVLRSLCLMSGGHMRDLMLLVRSAIDHIDNLPITEKAIQKAITQARNVYSRAIEDEEWECLAEVAVTKQIKHNTKHRKLLFNRCLLQYSYLDKDGDLQDWYDVHPLIREIKQFKECIQKYSSEGEDLINSKVFGELEDPSRRYQKALDKKDYAEAYKIADNAYNICENILTSLDTNSNRSTYLSAVAWSSYWKLKRDLYSDQKEAQKEVIWK